MKRVGVASCLSIFLGMISHATTEVRMRDLMIRWEPDPKKIALWGGAHL